MYIWIGVVYFSSWSFFKKFLLFFGSDGGYYLVSCNPLSKNKPNEDMALKFAPNAYIRTQRSNPLGQEFSKILSQQLILSNFSYIYIWIRLCIHRFTNRLVGGGSKWPFPRVWPGAAPGYAPQTIKLFAGFQPDTEFSQNRPFFKFKNWQL